MSHDLNDTLIFVKVVEHGSFVRAAKSLRLPKTTVSRKVQELESRLGAQLLHRTTRKLGLTEAGNVYYEHSQRIARDLNEAESAVMRRTPRALYHSMRPPPAVPWVRTPGMRTRATGSSRRAQVCERPIRAGTRRSRRPTIVVAPGSNRTSTCSERTAHLRRTTGSTTTSSNV